MVPPVWQTVRYIHFSDPYPDLYCNGTIQHANGTIQHALTQNKCQFSKNLVFTVFNGIRWYKLNQSNPAPSQFKSLLPRQHQSLVSQKVQG